MTYKGKVICTFVVSPHKPRVQTEQTNLVFKQKLLFNFTSFADNMDKNVARVIFEQVRIILVYQPVVFLLTSIVLLI